MKKKQIKEVKRFTRYMVGGGAQFWSGYAAFAAFDIIFNISFWPAKVASYFVGISINFFIERFWVFGRKRLGQKQLNSSAERYYLLMILNFALDLAIVGGLRAVHITPYLGQFASAGFFTVWNYILFKIWVFRHGPRKRAA